MFKVHLKTEFTFVIDVSMSPQWQDLSGFHRDESTVSSSHLFTLEGNKPHTGKKKKKKKSGGGKLSLCFSALTYTEIDSPNNRNNMNCVSRWTVLTFNSRIRLFCRRLTFKRLWRISQQNKPSSPTLAKNVTYALSP